MKQFLARVLETESVTPALVRVAFATTDFPASQTGHFFLVRPNSLSLDPYLRRVWFAPRVVGERIEFWVSDLVSLRATEGSPRRTTERSEASSLPKQEIASSQKTFLAMTDIIDFIGPLGRGFQIPREAKHLAVVAENAQCAAPLLGLVEMLVREERELVVACGEPALPEFLIPPEVEYRASKNALDALGDGWQWGEFLIASGTRAFYAELKNHAPRVIPTQALIRDMQLPCGVGACYACAFQTREGMKLVCRDGPVFEL